MEEGVISDDGHDGTSATTNRKSPPVVFNTAPDWVMQARRYLTLVFIALLLSGCHFAASQQCLARPNTNDLEEWSGTIRSANFGLVAYPNNEDCQWVIRVSLGSQISVHFNLFELEAPGGNGQCYDFVQIFDGGNTNAPSLGIFCGSTVPSDMISSSHELTIRFRSDNTQGFRGFSMDYTGVCSAVSIPVAAEESVVIESPLYPATPPSQPPCSWSVAAPDGYYVDVAFTDFQPSTDSCDDTNIQVYDGVISESASLATVCPDTTAPSSLMSTTNTVIVAFDGGQTSSIRFSIQCTARYLPCSSDPCQSDGTCSNNFQLTPPTYQCACPAAYTGAQCETEVDECAAGPCGTHAQQCIDLIGSFECVCSSGFTGVVCDTDIDECANPDVCFNSGICINNEGSFECQCMSGFTGKFCETDINECDESPCQNGGICTNQAGSFTCDCEPGYEGETCAQDIDECLQSSNLCQNGGQCINVEGSYRCECLSSYIGQHCQEDVDECATNPCSNGATCTNTFGSYLCDCTDGFEGLNCDNDVNECALSPCLNWGTCVNTPGSYHCNCSEAYTGMFCNEDADECVNEPCLNHGTCTNTIGSYRCECPPSSTGKNCEVDVNECFNSPCQNSGSCIDTIGSYQCVCTAFYTGQHCDVDVQECETDPCLNGGTCSNLIGSYLCQCTPGYEGRNCEVDSDECVNNPCLNGGSCSNTVGSYKCSCPPSFTGHDCAEDVNECDVNPCANDGTCSNLVGSYLCDCTPAFTGRHCEDDVDECQSRPCLFGGNCTNTIGSYFCQCIPVFTGQNCEVDLDECAAHPCLNGGTCSNGFGVYSCTCTSSYTGQHCETDVNECETNPCLNGGTCSNSIGSYQCECTQPFRGPNCEEDVNECETNPCMNGGVCSNYHGTYQCECGGLFVGPHCEEDVNECLENPCLHGGTCTNIHGGFTCACPATVTGPTCQDDVDECALDAPCMNDATCINEEGGYSCACAPGYKGPVCSQDINECTSSSPCLNEAPCTNTFGSYTCECGQSFTGKNCEIDVNECLAQPCNNRGRCINTFGGFACVCTTSYQGPLCDEDVNECDIEGLCEHGGSCLNTDGSFTCNCADGFEGQVCEINIDDCADSPCQNEGQCIDGDNSFTCVCGQGYYGDKCEIVVSESIPDCEDGRDSITGLYWDSIAAGKTAETPCPQGTTGIATRICSAYTDVIPPLSSWETPDLSQCINPQFQQVTEKLDELDESVDVTVDDVIDLASLLSNLTSYTNETSSDVNELHIVPRDITITTMALSTVAELTATINQNLTEADIDDLTNAFVDTVDHILDDSNLGAWQTTDDTDTVTQQLTSVVTSSEDMALSMARARSRLVQNSNSTSLTNNQSLTITKANIEFDIVFVAASESNDSDTMTFSRPGGSLSLPAEVLSIANQESTDQLAIYRARYPSLASLYSALDEGSISRINTDVIATKILGVDEALFRNLAEPVVGMYKHQELGANINPSCVFLDLSKTSGDESELWKATGCQVYASNETHTTCHCYHLTNFAVIMDVHGVQDSLSESHETALSILSQIGGSMSIVGCVTSVAVYEFFRLKSDRIRVHENLGIAIAISQLIFLVGMERTDVKWLCKAVAISFHYTITAMFCWMLLEGVHLYVMLVKVFGTGSNTKKYLLAGWGIPAIVAGVSAGIFYNEYATANVCWMSSRAMLISFIPTVAIVIIVNTAFLIMVLHVMMRSMSAKYKSRVSNNTSQVKAGLKAAAILLPLLGLTWVFGFLSVNAQTLAFTYIFAILNSFQGLFFFIAHCVLNMEVRKAYDRRYGKTKHGVVSSSTGLSSMSNTTSGKGANRKSSTKALSISGSSKKKDNDTVALCRKGSDDSNGQDFHDNSLKSSSVDETNNLNNGLNANQDSIKKKLSPDGPLQHNEIQCLVKESEKNINQGNQNGGLSKEAKVAMENLLSKSNVTANNENIA